MKVVGLAAIDARTAAAQGLLAWRSELVGALGGEGTVTPQQMALVELATRTRLYVDHLDGFLMAQPSLVHRARKSVLPVLRERQQLADSLARLLGQLGLERRAAKAIDLNGYLSAQYGNDRETGPQPATATEAVPNTSRDPGDSA